MDKELKGSTVRVLSSRTVSRVEEDSESALDDLVSDSSVLMRSSASSFLGACPYTHVHALHIVCMMSCEWDGDAEPHICVLLYVHTVNQGSSRIFLAVYLLLVSTHNMDLTKSFATYICQRRL